MEANLTKQTIWIGIATGFTALSELIFVPIFTKLFSSETYGVWVTYITIVQLITPITLLGLTGAFIRFTAGVADKEEIRENFYSAFVIIFAFSLLISLLFSLTASHLPAKLFGTELEVHKLIKVGSFLIFSWALELFVLSYYRAFLRIRRYAILIITQTSLEILAVLFLATHGYKLITIACFFIAIRFAIFILCYTGIVKEIGIKAPDFSNIRPYLYYGLPLIVSPALVWIVKLSDRLIIKYFLDFSAVGVYSAAYNIGSVITLYSVTLQGGLAPTLCTLWNKNEFKKARDKLSLSMKYFLLLAIPSCFGLLALSKEILRVFTRPEFIEKGYLIIPIVGFAITCYGIYFLSANVLGLVKKTYLITIILGVGALINVVLNFLLIPRINILGAAIATLIAFIFMALVMVLTAHKYFKFGLNPNFVAKSIVASGIMAFIIRQLSVSNLWTLIFAMLIAIVVYGILIFLLKGISKEEILDLKRSLLK